MDVVLRKICSTRNMDGVCFAIHVVMAIQRDYGDERLICSAHIHVWIGLKSRFML